MFYLFAFNPVCAVAAALLTDVALNRVDVRANKPELTVNPAGHLHSPVS